MSFALHSRFLPGLGAQCTVLCWFSWWVSMSRWSGLIQAGLWHRWETSVLCCPASRGEGTLPVFRKHCAMWPPTKKFWEQTLTEGYCPCLSCPLPPAFAPSHSRQPVCGSLLTRCGSDIKESILNCSCSLASSVKVSSFADIFTSPDKRKQLNTKSRKK